ncbi:MAG: TGS domain-containing protein [Candidatus Woesearchaeota archaeon]|nr:MAG: TGS domain-containing protein [Candidatus Woesearchaeota archaeon]
MPTNVSIDYKIAEREYQEATTDKDRLKALRKMLSTAPTHKGAEKMRAHIRKQISKYKDLAQKEGKTKKVKSLSIKKEGAGQIVFVGLPNSGKSTLLSKLSKKHVEIADYEFTTTEPIQRMIPFENIKLQGVEIPAIYDGFYESENGRQFFGLIRNSDFVIIVLKSKDGLPILKKEFEKANINLNSKSKYHEGFIDYMPSMKITWEDFDDQKLINKIWKKLDRIRVQTRAGRKVAEKPIILNRRATVRDVAKKIHKDFIKKFKYAKIWGPSAKFDAQQVGLEHELKDNDIVEIFIK